MTDEKLKELKTYLESVAEEPLCSEDEGYNAYDASGGNFDDAFDMGTEDGRTWFAKELLKKFFNG